jgi:hypothetical protein
MPPPLTVSPELFAQSFDLYMPFFSSNWTVTENFLSVVLNSFGYSVYAHTISHRATSLSPFTS